MDRTEQTIRHMLTAIEGPLYDVGVLSNRGMLPGLDAIPAEVVVNKLRLLKFRNARGSHIYLRPFGEHRYTVLDDLDGAKLARLSADGFEPCAVVETSQGNFQAWLKHTTVLPKLLGTYVAQTLAAQYGADPSAADWRRFGRLPGFTNCKAKYQRPDGLFPFVRLHSHSGQQFSRAQPFLEEITAAYEGRERQREQRRTERVLSPQKGRRSVPSLERFRTSAKYADRPAAADIAFCVAALSSGMEDARIEQALTDEYLSRDPSQSKRAAYILRTIGKARDWAMPSFGLALPVASQLLRLHNALEAWEGFYDDSHPRPSGLLTLMRLNDTFNLWEHSCPFASPRLLRNRWQEVPPLGRLSDLLHDLVPVLEEPFHIPL